MRPHLTKLKAYLLKNYGEKCGDYDPTCIVCVVWRAWEELDKIERR